MDRMKIWMHECMDDWKMRTRTSRLIICPLPTLILSPPRPNMQITASQTKIAKWVMAATMTTIYDEDDNEYDELLLILLTRKCQSEKWIETVKRLLYGRIRGSGFVGQ